MHEAVEIAKLRLFLKLVATVDVNVRKPNFGLEPLPDIDFNIRAGNTLVGFATEQELLQTIQKKEPLFAQGILDDFKEEFGLVSKAYARFQNSQVTNDQGSEDFKQAKAELNRRLDELNNKLNVNLASNYGIDAERKPKEFKKWLLSHQPFHWFAEYYQIIGGKGGFDVIIGNPPYVSIGKVGYTLKDYSTLPCGDVYALVMERCSANLIGIKSKFAMIVPISLVSTDGYSTLREILSKTKISYAFSNFGVRPAKLFDGVDKRLTIFISIGSTNKVPLYFTSKYYRWQGNERKQLFQKLTYTISKHDLFNISCWPKVSDNIENRILNRIGLEGKSLAYFILKGAGKTLSFTRKLQYFIQFFKDAPRIYNQNGTLLKPSELKYLSLKTDNEVYALSCVLNSNLFFWYFISFSDCRNVNYREIKGFPCDLGKVSLINELKNLCLKLWENLKRESVFLERNDSKSGKLRIESYQPRKSKSIIDQIDTVLAQHYGFSEEELDFIINYDIKYRMGKALFGEGDSEEEEESEE
jgi:hypothetical protein